MKYIKQKISEKKYGVPKESYKDKLKRQTAFIKSMQQPVKEKTVKKEQPQEFTQPKKTDVWDVAIDDPIDFFDPELSYELTGYRPINATQGLDFDPIPFQLTGNIYENTGSYTTYLPGSKLYSDFWKEQIRRCNEGYTVGKYTITGDHYFFLNFYRLEATKLEEGKIAAYREESFPSFYVEQYKWFHYFRMCELLAKDACALKPRGVGWSELAVSMGLKVYTCKRKSKCIYAAQSESQLTPTLTKIWNGMEFLNLCTGGGMKHLRSVVDQPMRKRASYRLRKEGTEVGFLSEIEGLIINNPRKMRGSRVERLFYEEFGSNTLGKQAWVQGEALVTIGGRRIGVRVAWGTGGDTGPQLQALSDLFYNPITFNILPYKNNFNATKETVYTSFFMPAYTMLPDFMDSRGYCNEEEAINFYNKERMLRANDPQALLMYKAEFCFIPEEALIREGNNRFDSEKLSEQLANIQLHKLIPTPKRGTLSFPFNKELGQPDFTQMPTFELSANGKIQITEYPMTDETQRAYTNLYVGGIDSIDSDSSSSSGQTDVSNFCIVIMRRQLGLQDPKIVALYKDRPRDVRTAYNNAIKLLMWYNCKAVVEATRVSIITYFKEKNKLSLLFKRTRATLSDVQRKRVTQYGVPATTAIIEHQLELIEQFVFDYCHTIDYPEVLEELLKYSVENKRKFDIVAALGMVLLGDEELYGVTPKTSTTTTSSWRDIGYYYENGVKRFGVIPVNYDENQARQRLGIDWIGNRYY